MQVKPKRRTACRPWYREDTTRILKRHRFIIFAIPPRTAVDAAMHVEWIHVRPRAIQPYGLKELLLPQDRNRSQPPSEMDYYHGDGPNCAGTVMFPETGTAEPTRYTTRSDNALIGMTTTTTTAALRFA